MTPYLQSIIAVVGSVVIAASPVMAAMSPCCCLRPIEVQRNCCHVKQLQTEVPAGKECCATRLPVHETLTAACGCCVKSVPQPLTERTESVQPAPPPDGMFWDAHPVEIADSGAFPDRVSTDANSVSGPPLLALLCRWLK